MTGRKETADQMTIHPLIKTLEQVGALGGQMGTLKVAPESTFPENAEWVPLQSLLTPTGEPLCALMRRVGSHFKVENRRVPASLFFGDYAFALMALACACYLVDRRVPQLTLESVWARFSETGDVEGMALSDYHFAALADDPAAGHEDCTVLPSTDALQAYLLEQASACLQPLTQAVRARSTLGIPAMWALAADYTASAATYVARLMNDEATGLEVARQLSARQSPLRRKRDFIHIEECGLSYEMVDRISCCLYFQVEGGHYCSSCPHRPPEERIDLIKKWLANSAVQQQIVQQQETTTS
jgi:hypothetical protein